MKEEGRRNNTVLILVAAAFKFKFEVSVSLCHGITVSLYHTVSLYY
jgi:hypothetical protein